jgi:hypothetical protein
VAPYLKNYKYCACVMPGDDVEKCIKKCNNGERFNLRYCGCVPVYTNICSQVYCPNRSERPDYSTCSCVSKATPVGLCTPCRAGMTQDKYCNCIPIPNPNKLT